MANEFGSTIQGGDFKPQLASMYDQPGMTTDEIRRRMIQQRKLPLEALKKGESVQFQGVSGPAEQPFESDEADIANFMIEFEKKRRKEREGRSPQSVTSDQLASVLDVPGVPESMSPMIGSELESFGVLQSDMAPDLGPLEPKAIIEGAAKVPLRPGVSPDVMEEISAPVPQRFGPKTRPIPAKEPSQGPSETPVDTNIYGGGETVPSDIIPESEIVGPPVPPMDMRTDFEVDEDIAKQIAAAFEDPDEKDRMEQRATAGSLFGGEYGGLIGADIGLKNLETRQKQQFELEKQKRTLEAQKAKSQTDVANQMMLAGYKEGLSSETKRQQDLRKAQEAQKERALREDIAGKKLTTQRDLAREKMDWDKRRAKITDRRSLVKDYAGNKITQQSAVVRMSWNKTAQAINDAGGLEAYADGSLSKVKGISDVALINSFVRSIDPGSVVRPSEVEMSISGLSELKKLSLLVQRQSDPKTGLLSKEARLEFVAAMKSIVRGQDLSQSGITKNYLDRAKELGVDSKYINRELPGIIEIKKTKKSGGASGADAAGKKFLKKKPMDVYRK